MKRLSIENKVAVDMMPRITMTIGRSSDVEGGAYNAVHSEVARFLDTIRRNEGLTTILARSDSDESMVLRVGFTEHSAAKAIEDALVKKASSVCARYGIKTVRVGFSDDREAKQARTVFTDNTTNEIWTAFKEWGIANEGLVAGDIRWQAVFFIGPAGSGKTFVRNMRYVRHLDFKVIDPDAVKAAHPDYNPDRPSDLHEWSKDVSNSQYKAIIEEGSGTPVIVDGTGRNIDGILSKIYMAKQHGYNTYVVYVYVPFEVSIWRNRNRTRFVPETAIMEQSEKIKKNFMTLRMEADQSKVIPNYENPEFEKAKADIEVYPVPQKVRPPRPGDPMYGVKALAASVLDVVDSLMK